MNFNEKNNAKPPEIQLWDILSGKLLQNFGSTVTFEEEVERHFQMMAIPNWFSLDTKLGSISVHLDYSQCFNAVVYAQDAGLDFRADPTSPRKSGSLSSDQSSESISTSSNGITPNEIKVNLGERVLRGLFSQWRRNLLRAKNASNTNASLSNSVLSNVPNEDKSQESDLDDSKSSTKCNDSNSGLAVSRTDVNSEFSNSFYVFFFQYIYIFGLSL